MEKLRDNKSNSRKGKVSASDKTAKEMTKSSSYKKYSLHEDTNSDFTVLDLHKDGSDNVGEDFHDIVTDQSNSSGKFNGGRTSKPINKNRTKDACSQRKDMNMTLIKLEKLLRQEPNLVKKNDIFHCIGTMKSLLGYEQPDGEIKSSTNVKVK